MREGKSAKMYILLEGFQKKFGVVISGFFYAFLVLKTVTRFFISIKRITARIL